MYRCPVLGPYRKTSHTESFRRIIKPLFLSLPCGSNGLQKHLWYVGDSVFPLVILPFSPSFFPRPLAHRCSRTACILGVFPKCVYIYIYIAACIPQPLINMTAIPDFSRKASMWERKQHGAENNPQIGRKRCFQKKTE